MAVVKHAQKVIESVIKSQRIKPVKVPENHYMYKIQEEAPGMYEEKDLENTENQLTLKTGMAMTYRVNNPYKYTETDDYGEPVYKAVPWGTYKGAEIGGNRDSDAGALYDLHFGGIAVNMDKVKIPTARIYYSQQSHMHRVSSMSRVNSTGGPYSIIFEDEGGFKHPLDGFNRSFALTPSNVDGFRSPEQAVSLCIANGFAYEVELPRHRYSTRKSYADNFKYRPLKLDD